MSGSREMSDAPWWLPFGIVLLWFVIGVWVWRREQ
jgi:hypothetical protein